jgi:hypothetical protein
VEKTTRNFSLHTKRFCNIGPCIKKTGNGGDCGGGGNLNGTLCVQKLQRSCQSKSIHIEKKHRYKMLLADETRFVGKKRGKVNRRPRERRQQQQSSFLRRQGHTRATVLDPRGGREKTIRIKPLPVRDRRDTSCFGGGVGDEPRGRPGPGNKTLFRNWQSLH